MFAKLCGGGDTPWVTLKCIFINRSPNVTIDHTDGDGGGEKEENFKTKSCCCFQRRRRPQNENELTTTMNNVNVKETIV
jgi:hypothetical protein